MNNLDCVQSDKKIKTLTDTAELIEDAVHSATVIIIVIISYNLCSEIKLQFCLPFLNNLERNKRVFDRLGCSLINSMFDDLSQIICKYCQLISLQKPELLCSLEIKGRSSTIVAIPFVVPVLWEWPAIEWVADAIALADFDSNGLITLQTEDHKCQKQSATF